MNWQSLVGMGGGGGSGGGGGGSSTTGGKGNSEAHTTIVGRDNNTSPVAKWLPIVVIGGVGLLLFVGLLILVKKLR